LNGYYIPEEQEVEKLFWEIARGEIDHEKISRWLKAWFKPYPEG
jgi:prophage maintenance system killer protein